MDPENHIYTTNQTTAGVAPVPSNGKKSPMEMVKQLLSEFKTRLSGHRSFEWSPQPTSQSRRMQIIFVLKIVVIVLVLLILLFVFVAAFNLVRKQITPAVVPTASSTPVSILVTPPPTKYATDPVVLKLDDDIKTLDSELTRTDIEENNLKPRPFAWDINF